MEIKNQAILISGGASGLGAETARYLSQQGARIILLDVQRDRLQTISNEIDASAFECDITNSQATWDALQRIIKEFNTIRVCINCAGIAPAERMVGRKGPMPLDNFRKVIDVNLIGSFNLMSLCSDIMINQEPINDDGERGVIINTASVAAYEGQIGQTAYAASKGGIVSLTLPAARELAQFGIRVITIAPGVMSTPMMEAMPSTVRESLINTIPFPHRLGYAQEYARLVSEIIQNRYLNGCVIRLDGALRMNSK